MAAVLFLFLFFATANQVRPLEQYEVSQCEILAAKASLEDRNIIVDTHQQLLHGTWISHGCETRPGPEFVLRIYTFHRDGYYKLIQHHYWDESCSSPKLTMVSFGHLVLTPYAPMHNDAVTGNPKPFNITITPHDQKAAKELDVLVASQCRDKRWKPWRKYEEHVVFNTRQHQNSKPAWEPSLLYRQSNYYQFPKNIQETSGDISCLSYYQWAFKELHLLKIQLRPILKTSYKDIANEPMRLELLLGDIHSRKDFQERYESSGFQVPLLKFMKNQQHIELKRKKYTIQNSCSVCSTLYSSDRTPPHLIKKPQLPAYVWGEWVSTRCESRPMGLFLLRKFGFYLDESYWIGEHKFYLDPFCTKQSFSVTAAGHFSIPGPSQVIPNSHNVDFNIEKASLALYSPRMIHDLRGLKNCGTEYWVKSVPQDISLTNGCIPLGIIIPSVQYDIVKIEMNYEGSCLLMLGQSDTDNIPRTKFDRPTSFDFPLVKCGEDTISTSLHEVVGEGFLKDSANVGVMPSNCLVGYILLLLYYFFRNL